MIKFNYLITIIILIGILTLFFFPEPETNFIFYALTGLFFVALIVALLIFNKKSKNKV